MTDTDDPDKGRSLKFPVCRLWERQGESGPYLSGVLGGARVLICRNGDRSDENDAPWLLVLGPNDQPKSRKRKEER